MLNNINPTVVSALAPFAPPGSFTEEQLREADRHYEWLKTSGELERRRIEKALKLEQQQRNDAYGWSA